MKRELKSLITKTLSLLAVISAMVAGLQSLTKDEHFLELKGRSERIFAFDKQNQDCSQRCLPQGRVRALSIALAFHDVKGTQMLLSELENFARN